jgi:hypothetical protein
LLFALTREVESRRQGWKPAACHASRCRRSERTHGLSQGAEGRSHVRRRARAAASEQLSHRYCCPCRQTRLGGTLARSGPSPLYHFSKAVLTSSPSMRIWFHIPQWCQHESRKAPLCGCGPNKLAPAHTRRHAHMTHAMRTQCTPCKHASHLAPRTSHLAPRTSHLAPRTASHLAPRTSHHPRPPPTPPPPRARSQRDAPIRFVRLAPSTLTSTAVFE